VRLLDISGGLWLVNSGLSLEMCVSFGIDLMGFWRVAVGFLRVLVEESGVFWV